MTITTLDRDFNLNHLEVYRGGNGDVYITVYEQEDENSLRKPHTVRIGMGGSGSRIPGDVMHSFSELAKSFEKYQDCKDEFEAEKKHIKEMKESNMTLELKRKDIIHLLRGTEPPYEVMEEIPNCLGYYCGGFKDEWVWDIDSRYEDEDTKQYSDEYLYNLYLKCKN